MKAIIFPGQGSQFPGMGADLYQNHKQAAELFQQANQILGFDIAKTMFEGSQSDLKQTKVTQPAVFLHSVIMQEILGENAKPEMVAGHSLGEFSALVANGSLSFEDALELVSKRAKAMQKACETEPSTMAAILGMEEHEVEAVCAEIDGTVVAANYNSPGQIVISGDRDAVEKACEELKDYGAKRALLLPVGGAFHSPLMEPAREELAEAIERVEFKTPFCPVYQNVSTFAVTQPAEIKKNLIFQLTSPVKWTQTIQNMIADGATEFTEVGPGKVLRGLMRKIDRKAVVTEPKL
jgi:[acyl-carrier-protein] S-malonyltransferase